MPFLFRDAACFVTLQGAENSDARTAVTTEQRRSVPTRPASLAASAGRWAWPAGGGRRHEHTHSVGSRASQCRPQDCGKCADCSRFAARLRALRPSAPDPRAAGRAQQSPFCWSGGAAPAHGMRISCVEPGPAGSSCPPCVTLGK